ncbi:MAG: hypothetical protein ACE5KG_00765 [Nitrososphaerales archaeon]
MKLFDLSSDEERTRSIYKILAIISGLVILGTGSYGVVATSQLGVEVVGETLVTVEFPPISGFPIYKPKPVTWLMGAVFVFIYAGFNLNRKLISSFPPFVIQSLKLFSLFVALMAIYEIFFNFTIWGSLMAADQISGQLNPDILTNPFPLQTVQWNLVFATKMFTLIAALSIYSYYFLQRIVPTKRKVKSET